MVYFVTLYITVRLTVKSWGTNTISVSDWSPKSIQESECL